MKKISLLRVSLLLSISLLYVFGPAFSAPVSDILEHEHGNVNQPLITTEVSVISESAANIASTAPDQNQSTLASREVSQLYIPNVGDYITSEREFCDLLLRLKKEAEENVASNPANYANDDVDLTELLNSIRTSDLRDLSEITQSTQSPETSDDCPICLEPLDGGATVEALPCAHKYHLDCIRKWVAVVSI